eukprot:scaffold15149_cov194-Skeletonema_marinoi.AAC.3
MSNSNSSNLADEPKQQPQYAPPNRGSNPPKYKYNSLPVPWWFNPASVSKFHSLPLHSTDIILSSGVKMGTTWMNKILISLLHEFDNEGQLIPEVVDKRAELPGRLGQTYPEGVYPTRREHEEDSLGILSRLEQQGRKAHLALFGNFVLEDLVEQPEPRIFATHLSREYLPRELFDGGEDGEGTGKLIVVIRNLKDAMCSLHNFRGLPQDGWFGNEHGPGTFARYLMLNGECPNAFGSAFEWLRDNNDAVMSIGNKRALVVYYESLIMDFNGQLQRINDFLELGTLTDAKAQAIEEACALKSMQNAEGGARYKYTTRKGGIGKWSQAPLTKEHWKEFDSVFDKVLGDVEIADPFRFFQYESVPGMPEALGEFDLDTDPRRWEPYLLVMLRDGMIVPDPYFRLDGKDDRGELMDFKYNKPQLSFDECNCDGSPRYHLFVSESCPLASAVSAARTLLGLDSMISMDVADGKSGAGLVFLNGCSCAPWKGSEGPFWLYSVYQLSNSIATTLITAPVLWDTVEQKIVSNDAWEILKLMSHEDDQSDLISYNDALGVILKEGLCPREQMEAIENMYSDLSSSIFNVEDVGLECIAQVGKDGRVDDNFERILTKLQELNDLLGKRRFLLGNNLTGVDIFLAMFLFRFDACYTPLFGLSNHGAFVGSILMGDSYPNLKGYSRELYQELKSTLKIQGFRQIFRLPCAISFTRQAIHSTNASLPSANEPIPDLNQIVGSLEEPATGRPEGAAARPSNSAPRIIRDGMTMPMWFRDDTVQLYRDLDLRDDDIILSSGVKMGTTWVTKILNSLLYDFDDDGKTTSAYMDDSFPNRLGQTYPDALFPSREVEKHEMATKDEEFVKRMKMLKTNFGDFVFDDLLNQPSPRLFSSHLSGKNLLPKKLFDGWKDGDDCAINGDVSNGDKAGPMNKGIGRLIVVVRNLKDTLVSLHHFRGVPKDGWLGNEHGPGSYARAIDIENCPNAFGSSFLWVKRSGEVVDAVGPERALVLQYEDLKLDFDTQLQRINDFLGLSKLTDAKAKAVAAECAAKSMKEKTGGRFKMIIRKGMVGDWQNYLDDERWEEFDRVFDKVLGGVDIAEPLRQYQCKEGLDEITAAQEKS